MYYAFPYMSLGMLAAKSSDKGKNRRIYVHIAGFVLSMVLLAIESFILVVKFNTSSTILWLSVLPATYCLFLICLNVNIQIPKMYSLFIRKLSTLIYVSHNLFIIAFSQFQEYNLVYCGVVSLSSLIFAVIVIKASDSKYLHWLKCLY